MDPVLERLRTALAERYDVVQEIGRGGMAVVYLARDRRHPRRVVLKVLRTDLDSSGGERFMREIETVAQLHHPHIVTLHDSGAVDGHPFYVMPFVEGETLRERLNRDGQLSLDEAIRITSEVADALDFAHSRGVIHRDVKPENIFLSAGHALVADFGIARAANASGDTLTDLGVAIGTAAYMSPEQATADPRIDGRSDQYALGCLLYEMLAGQPPFTGPTSQAIMRRHTVDPVPPISTVRTIPPELERALSRALEKSPADRWSTTREFAAAVQGAGSRSPSAPPTSNPWRLTRTVLLVAAVVLAGFAWLAGSKRGRAQPAAGDRTLVLLPFTLSGDSSQQTMADYLTEQVTVGLVGVEGLHVKSQSSAFEDPQVIGERAGAHAVLQARVLVEANSIRVFPRLVDVASGTTIWQQQFNGELTVGSATGDAFAIVDSVTAKIVDALLPHLTREQRAVAQRGVRTRNAEALRVFLQARSVPYAPADSGNRKIALFRRAVEIDSTFADGWVALADAIEYVRSIQGVPPIEAVPEVRSLVNRAIDLDPQHSGAYALRARIAWFFDYDWQAALRDSKRAAELAPGRPDASAQLFWLLIFSNQPDSAVTLARKLVRVDSTSALPWGLLSVAHRANGSLDSSTRAGERAQAIDSLHEHLMDALVYDYIDVGRPADAERIARRFSDFENPLLLLVFARLQDRLGNKAGVRDFHDRLLAFGRRQPIPPGILASSHLLVGDTAASLRYLAEAARIRDRALPLDFVTFWARLRGIPQVDSLRARLYGTVSIPRDLFAPVR